MRTDSYFDSNLTALIRTLNILLKCVKTSLAINLASAELIKVRNGP